ncbi:hypothetical protein SAMN05518861_105289 [Mesorhizobium sp. YR577]|nr:hypothetical protein SAMN05518861_105289 [Mesorhizobium sp. YR577]
MSASDITAVAGNQGIRRLLARLRRTRPSVRVASIGAALWAVAMAGSALFNLMLDAWETPEKMRTVTTLFAAGGFLAFPLGLWGAAFLSQGKRAETAFAAAFVSFAVATIGVTAVLYAIQYRLYYAQWHADAFTVIWAFQIVFTGLAALYQFTVLGIRLFFPVGFVVLFIAALWFARRPH